MSFFDDSHVTEGGLQGSTGPSVGFGEMVSQAFQQQFRVDSARALDDELRNRWLESLRMAQIDKGRPADPHEENTADPYDPWAYRAFSQYVRGQPIDAFEPNRPLWGYDPNKRIKGMIAANEAIKKLNNPDIKSFEQIFEEVSQMQHEVEGETASMYERSGAGGVVASLLGAIGGSFTSRDPLNLITAPVGAGRTIATRIAAEMGIAAGVVGYTELAEVAPAREMVGLPERNPLFNIAAAAVGAGVIRGGLEGIGYGIRRLRSEDIDFDLRDSQLQQMFDANNARPSARAGAKALDDVQFIERNNPYGEGRAAQERFIAELRQVQRVMGGEPMTAVARALPPMPFESIKKAADFEIVREQAPEIYARMEAAQAKLEKLSRKIEQDAAVQHFRATVRSDAVGDFVISPINVQAKGEPGFSLDRTYEADGIITAVFRDEQGSPKGGVLIPLDEEQLAAYGGAITYVDPAYRRQGIATKLYNLAEEQGLPINRISGQGDLTPEGAAFVTARQARREANAEYQAAYRDVEAEAIRIREQQARVEATQQREAVGIFAEATVGRPFPAALLMHDHVQARVDAINAFNDTLDEKAVARFVRETVGEGEEAVEREVWRTDEGIDIGLREPVDPEFRISTDDGEMSVADAMRDLQDDVDLDDAMRTCLL